MALLGGIFTLASGTFTPASGTFTLASGTFTLANFLVILLCCLGKSSKKEATCVKCDRTMRADKLKEHKCESALTHKPQEQEMIEDMED